MCSFYIAFNFFDITKVCYTINFVLSILKQKIKNDLIKQRIFADLYFTLLFICDKKKIIRDINLYTLVEKKMLIILFERSFENQH